MHAFFHTARSSVRRHRPGFGRFRATVDEFRRSARAAQRYTTLKSLGVARASVCLRVFEEFYSMANVDQPRG